MNEDHDNNQASSVPHDELETRANFLRQLKDLEETITRLESNLDDEDDTDSFLTALQGDTWTKFDQTRQDVVDVAADVHNTVDALLQPVSARLDNVKQKTAERNVALGGVVYYAGIGSPCVEDTDVCGTKDSECRDGICQCKVGLSSDSLNQRCVESCDNGYGRTYQTVANYIIRGHNDAELSNSTLQKCKERCENEQLFACRSMDYFPDYMQCYLSSKVRGDLDDVIEDNGSDVMDAGWEYNAAGIHLQRDCKV